MSNSTEIKNLNFDEIRIDGGTQPRVAIDQKTVAEYAELLKCETKFPPVVVFYDGTTYWLADGFHRYFAGKRIECDCIRAEVHTGTQRDAILYSVGANADHGLRRSNIDKQKAVLTLLEDDEWSQWSDNEIARRCGVSQPFVSKSKSSLITAISEKSSPRTYKTKHGTIAKMNTSKIGRTKRRYGVGKSPAFQPVRNIKPALAQTNINLPHDPIYGARAIVSAMGFEYAHELIDSITTFLKEKKEG